jgi:hypothetical protein
MKAAFMKEFLGALVVSLGSVATILVATSPFGGPLIQVTSLFGVL